MQKDQRSGKELFEEWSEHDQSGVRGAAHHFTQSLSLEARMRLFAYDGERQREGRKNTTPVE